MLMLFLLLRKPDPGPLRTGAAILAAVAGTLSMVHGFALWPVGLVCLGWTGLRTRAQVIGFVAWIAAALVTFGGYVHGYNRSMACVRGQDCSIGGVAHHPAHYARFFVSLPGYVVPRFGPFGRAAYGFHLLLGFALLTAAIAVIVQSLRERAHSDRPPLPVALILFGLLFDVIIAIGRGSGRIASVSQSRFTMANIVLVTGLAVFAWGHAPAWRVLRDRSWWRHRVAVGVVAFGALAVFVVGQAVFTTSTGIDEGRSWHQIQLTQARVLANRDRIPRQQVMCYLRVFVTNSGTKKALELTTTWSRYIVAIERESLYVFSSTQLRKYRNLGPPDIRGVCMLPSATQLVPLHGGG